MIRNVVIHIMNEQPMLADLYEPPQASDVSLVCTNLRTMNGTRPVFIDHSASMFVLPYVQIRFLEVPAGSSGLPALGSGEDGFDAALNGHGPGATELPAPASEPELDLDEDFLRRVREI